MLDLFSVFSLHTAGIHPPTLVCAVVPSKNGPTLCKVLLVLCPQPSAASQSTREVKLAADHGRLTDDGGVAPLYATPPLLQQLRKSARNNQEEAAYSCSTVHPYMLTTVAGLHEKLSIYLVFGFLH